MSRVPVEPPVAPSEKVLALKHLAGLDHIVHTTFRGSRVPIGVLHDVWYMDTEWKRDGTTRRSVDVVVVFETTDGTRGDALAAFGDDALAGGGAVGTDGLPKKLREAALRVAYEYRAILRTRRYDKRDVLAPVTGVDLTALLEVAGASG